MKFHHLSISQDNKFKCNCTNPNDKSIFCTDNEITTTSAFKTTASDTTLSVITTTSGGSVLSSTKSSEHTTTRSAIDTSATTRSAGSTSKELTSPVELTTTTNGGIVTGTCFSYVRVYSNMFLYVCMSLLNVSSNLPKIEFINVLIYTNWSKIFLA